VLAILYHYLDLTSKPSGLEHLARTSRRHCATKKKISAKLNIIRYRFYSSIIGRAEKST